MFSGIVQNIGVIGKKEKDGRKYRFFFEWKHPEKSVRVGESIAVDGVCLTVTKVTRRGFGADVVGATARATTLGVLGPGDEVNLERSLKSGDRISGHFVSGHVDGRGTIDRIEKIKRDWVYHFTYPDKLRPFIALKGSVSINGISLTVQSVSSKKLSIAIIPHTYHATTLCRKRRGDLVNIEVDMMARYAVEQMKAQVKTGNPSLSETELRSQGF